MEIKRDDCGMASYESYDDYDDYFIIGRTRWFTTEGEIIQKYLKDDTPVYAIDNCTKITTIKELIQ